MWGIFFLKEHIFTVFMKTTSSIPGRRNMLLQKLHIYWDGIWLEDVKDGE